MDVDDIVVAKAVNKTLIAEDVVDEAFNDETARVSPSTVIDPMVEDDEEIANLEDKTDQ